MQVKTDQAVCGKQQAAAEAAAVDGGSSPDDAEHVDVCIVSGEVDEDRSGSSVQPKVVHQFLHYVSALLLAPTQILIVPRSAVGR